MLSPSSGLCTIYEAMETSDEEDEVRGEQNTNIQVGRRRLLNSQGTLQDNQRQLHPVPPQDLEWNKKVDMVQQLINQSLMLSGDGGCPPLLLLPVETGGTLSPLKNSLWPNLPQFNPPTATVTSVSSYSPDSRGSSPAGDWTVMASPFAWDSSRLRQSGFKLTNHATFMLKVQSGRDTCIFDPSPLSLLPCSITGSQLTADPSCRAPSAGGRTWLRVTAARRAPVSPGGGPAPVLSDDEQEAPKAALAFYIPGRPALRDADPPVQELTSWRLEVMVPSPPLLNLPLRLRRLRSKHLSRLAGYFSYFVIIIS
ncbi:hypothetical protein XENOCAPTIV_024028 [Xenoophorus captivus]|uniref:Uncharacterized protein n=1 Tax=Xenoophorus captivus TaxID=1517983 RepID=A0ABV0R5Z6_9TELE